ncbi:MAG: type 1 glutamine amidotransferase [Syntrophorhabdaceae bacterium]|nr:type 1 glutamine amidotransferase [Syntrophorhabdaceae bacterium]
MEKRLLVIKQVEEEGPGYIADLFLDDGWNVEVLELSGAGTNLPHDLDDVGGIVVLGGPMNVYQEDAYPFLRNEESFIRRALIDEVPLLGICLGAQLVAKTCGARITRSPKKEIGWSTVMKTREGMDDNLFRGNPQHMTVFQWHEDTFDVPDDGVLLAKGRVCPNQAFKVGHCAYGLQFHIEVTPEMVEAWMENERGIDVARIIRDGRKIMGSFADQGKRVITNFKRIVESSLQSRKVVARFMDEGSWPEQGQEDWWRPCER